MYEEQRLMSIGFSLDEAVSLCHSLRKEGKLQEFVEEQERRYREVCRRAVDEVMG